jgi:hypothetical protein
MKLGTALEEVAIHRILKDQTDVVKVKLGKNCRTHCQDNMLAESRRANYEGVHAAKSFKEGDKKEPGGWAVSK